MSVYEERLAADKHEIRRRVAAVGDRVGRAIGTAVEGLLGRDEPTCARVVLGDLPVNRETRALNKLCHVFIARHLPSGSHLRFVSAVLQMNIAIERIGDYAVTVAREGVQLTQTPPDAFAREIRQLTRQATSVLECALRAFSEGNADLARATKPQTADTNRAYDRVYRDLLERGDELPLPDAFALLTVAYRLQRVNGQAKNICEETLFELTGETKPPKRYRILFVDARDTLVAPLAVALARKSFPESGRYDSAGYQAGDRIAPELEDLAQALSLDLGDLTPQQLPTDHDDLDRYHAIVGLSPKVREHIKGLPYTTVYLEWKLPLLANGAEGGAVADQLRELSVQLNSEIHDLMVTMRGEDAS